MPALDFCFVYRWTRKETNLKYLSKFSTHHCWVNRCLHTHWNKRVILITNNLEYNAIQFPYIIVKITNACRRIEKWFNSERKRLFLTFLSFFFLQGLSNDQCVLKKWKQINLWKNELIYTIWNFWKNNNKKCTAKKSRESA